MKALETVRMETLGDYSCPVHDGFVDSARRVGDDVVYTFPCGCKVVRFDDRREGVYCENEAQAKVVLDWMRI